MFERGAGSITIVAVGTLIGHLVRRGDVNMSEAFLYVMLGLLIVLYWSFQAYLKFAVSKETDSVDSDQLSELKKRNEELTEKVDSHNTKINALIIRAGLG